MMANINIVRKDDVAFVDVDAPLIPPVSAVIAALANWRTSGVWLPPEIEDGSLMAAASSSLALLQKAESLNFSFSVDRDIWIFPFIVSETSISHFSFASLVTNPDSRIASTRASSVLSLGLTLMYSPRPAKSMATKTIPPESVHIR